MILTNGLQDTSGNVATPDRDYVSIKDAQPTCAALTGTLNSICLLTGAHLAIACGRRRAGGQCRADLLVFDAVDRRHAGCGRLRRVPDASIGVDVHRAQPAGAQPGTAADRRRLRRPARHQLLPRSRGAAHRHVGGRARRPGRSFDEPHAFQPGSGREGGRISRSRCSSRCRTRQRPGQAGRGLAGRDLPARH